MHASGASPLAMPAIAHPRAAEAVPCRSTRRLCSLDRPPPRTPGKADAQVPRRPDPRARHGAIAHYFFHLPGTDADVAFGLRDIEVAITPADRGDALVELYCVGDGFQTGPGLGRGRSIPIELSAQGRVLVRLEWPVPDVLDGHADPITAHWRVALSADAVASLDMLVVGAADAYTLIAVEPPAR